MKDGQSLAIFHNCFNGVEKPNLINANLYSNDEIALAIYKTAYMETHNSVNKDSLVSAIRWLFETYNMEQLKGQHK